MDRQHLSHPCARQTTGLWTLNKWNPEFNLKVQHPEAEGNRATMRGLCRNNTAIYQYMTET